MLAQAQPPLHVARLLGGVVAVRPARQGGKPIQWLGFATLHRHATDKLRAARGYAWYQAVYTATSSSPATSWSTGGQVYTSGKTQIPSDNGTASVYTGQNTGSAQVTTSPGTYLNSVICSYLLTTSAVSTWASLLNTVMDATQLGTACRSACRLMPAGACGEAAPQVPDKS